MGWWILTFLQNSRAYTSLLAQAETNRADHLFMSWATYKPARRPIYRTVRGTTIFCGYQYIWNTPNVVEQTESGDTITHTFGPIPLQPADHVWYYLWSIAGAFDQPCQGPLIHVPPPELPMPSARVYNTVPQNIPNMATTSLLFDTVWWDDGTFFNPANPDRFTIPINGLYEVGASFRYSAPAPGGASAQLQRGPAWPFCYHSHTVTAPGWPGAGFSLHTLVPLQAGHQIQVSTFHNFGAPTAIMIAPSDSPHFWIRLVGPYPS